MSELNRKVSTSHLARNAYLYVRQSTLRQVFENTESTKRQYALRQRAVALGWPDDAVVVIDDDLGQSGSQSNRSGFQHLVAEVGTGRAGIVMGLEVSRLARNSADWHRLVEICALTQTLILDEDGIYDPGDFNDRLLLGLKGTMSEAELHMLRARLRGGIESLASRGELRMPLPIGFVYDDKDRVALDPDTQIRKAIQLLFDTFTRTGSGSATVRALRAEHIDFPRRLRRGPGKGDVLWAPLEHSRVMQILHNPRYAGAFVFGKTRIKKGLDGHAVQVRVPADEWRIVLPDTHEGYISWETFQANQRRLRENAPSHGPDRRAGPPREGCALLQGLVICGRCGERMSVRYSHTLRGTEPHYMCQKRSVEFGDPVCQRLHGANIDARIGERLIELMTPVQLEVALAVAQALHDQLEQADALRRKQLERVRYEMEVARRRYLRVDPDNRLVADALEADWNDKLRALHAAEEVYDREHERARTVLEDRQREDIMALAQDFPRIWHDERTPQRERKRLVRLLIEDVTLTRDQDLVAHVRFRGGATETLHVERPKANWERQLTPPEVVGAIDDLLEQCTDTEIAERLNTQGLRSGSGKLFHKGIVAQIRREYALDSRYQRLRRRGLLTAEELAEHLDIRRGTVLKWRLRGLLRAHRYNDKGQYLYEVPGDELPRKGAHKRHALEKLSRTVQ